MYRRNYGVDYTVEAELFLQMVEKSLGDFEVRLLDTTQENWARSLLDAQEQIEELETRLQDALDLAEEKSNEVADYEMRERDYEDQIDELMNQIENLKNENEALESDVQDLSNQIETLENGD